MLDKNEVLRVGQLAERTGVSVHTIRHYERLGLLPSLSATLSQLTLTQPLDLFPVPDAPKRSQ